MSKKIKIKAVKTKEKLEYLHSFQIEYLDKENSLKSWEFVSRQGIDRLHDEIENGKSFSDGATIFACNRERNQVVLVKEFRVSQNRYLYALPAGLIDEGETIEEAAIREFKEETGMTFIPVMTDVERYSSVGLTNEKVNFVYGYFDGEPSSKYNEASEDIEAFIADRDMVIELLEKKEVPIRTALVLKYFFKLNEFFKR